VEPLTGLPSNGGLLALSINIRLIEVHASGKYSSLLRYGNNECLKKFYSTGPSIILSIYIIVVDDGGKVS
jgi:hypothetical protein